MLRIKDFREYQSYSCTDGRYWKLLCPNHHGVFILEYEDSTYKVNVFLHNVNVPRLLSSNKFFKIEMLHPKSWEDNYKILKNPEEVNKLIKDTFIGKFNPSSSTPKIV